jgi:CRP-like cAMP-binding protein
MSSMGPEPRHYQHRCDVGVDGGQRQMPPQANNLILRAIPAESRKKLLAHVETIQLSAKHVLCEPGSQIDFVYFPRTCVLSLLAVALSGHAVETATIGREGAFGLVAGMRSGESFPRCVVQVTGDADRIAVSHFRREFDRHPAVQRVVLSFIESLLVQVQQAVLCGTLHPIQARLARFLLMMQDRAGTDSFGFTQEFLANVLGVNRSTLTGAAGVLQSNKIISYRRGRVIIRDRRGLEGASCECYRVLRDQFERLLSLPGPGMQDRKRR